ncbi:3-methyl-2-oxobutanoate dehydrogenase subunit VorB [bacterium F16]|nr:3-methyl-2-oxobutanoate dehydrogenase subunit VorB [bacterium F16]
MHNHRLMKGNEAIVYGAILGGSTHYFGYPITPASEIAHTAAVYYPKCGREFLQAECEVSSVNMLYGAASAGGRAMTGTSGPGLSLMMEGISYIASAELPCVIVDVQRTGPGLGNIWPEQTDYNCTVKGGGHGNYHAIVMAPNSAQEMCDCAYQSFEIAEKYRAPVIILSDAYIGQMMEPVSLPAVVKENPRKEWALNADAASRDNLITSILMNADLMAEHNARLNTKYQKMKDEVCDWQEILCDDAEYVLVSYGISSRMCRTCVDVLRGKGIKAGLLRPKTLFPFPEVRLRELAKTAKKMIAVELSPGQMADDVKLAVEHKVPVLVFGWMGGQVPSAEEILERFEKEAL